METHRLKLLADALRISVNQLEKEVGVGTSTFSKAIQRSSQINKGIALRIVEKYPNVSQDWLLEGTGEMFTKEAATSPHYTTTAPKGTVTNWVLQMRNELYSKINSKLPPSEIDKEIAELEEELRFMRQLLDQKKKG